MEARREAPGVPRKRWPFSVLIRVPAPVLSFVLTAFLSSLIGTFTARGFHATLAELDVLGYGHAHRSRATGLHQAGEGFDRHHHHHHQSNDHQSQDAEGTGPHQNSTNRGQSGDSKIFTGASPPSAFPGGSAAVKTGPVLLWPMPLSVSSGNWTLALQPRFRILPRRSLPAIVSKAAARLTRNLFTKRSAGLDSKTQAPEQDLPMLGVLHIRIRQHNGFRGDHESQALGANESYSLHINVSPGIQPTAILEAASTVAALRGLETFRQLCRRTQQQGLVLLEQAPWAIVDQPRFPHRALALDTSERLLPVSGFHRLLQTMEQAKLNVLHWKLSTTITSTTAGSSASSRSDSDSSGETRPFPLDLSSLQGSSSGTSPSQRRALSETEVLQYTTAEAAGLVRAAEERGITVVPEIDIPGGVASWGLAYPELWPSRGCRSPLDISRNQSSRVLRTVLEELKAIFPGPALHLGGSVRSWACWQSGKREESEGSEESEKSEGSGASGRRRVAKWLAGRGMSVMDGYAAFVVEGLELALAAGWRRVFLKEEPFLHFGERLSERVVVESTRESGVKDAVVSIGLKALVTFPPQAPGVHGASPDWWDAHSWEPCADLNAIRTWPQVLGGVLRLPSPFLDSSAQQGPGYSGNVTATLGEGQGLEALAALAERLWSSSESLEDQGKEEVGQRLRRFLQELDATE